ncbi:bifunctional [glutamate--ammonia ligase]-adenylyl-L-tyrosine phosphorylase/[glutamate--ammonia-ligase] adenylyltransferase [Laribacter hongkongensis]|uniref:Bifunctional glutamine synthetase adenylyltransferase/adenylyl-removing enzyme n=1 Tax=Laribacter hongkongensis TaxID=168471 RepID=A0ABD4STC5_9NEIS|nr:bifunctional [glutamate--ammonia ligase]-adenylyl-L-tyrosine phosphorylase/[glutamate--ammonia-ligase] adenylyltransferase [Laribacter hongkongensis]MCG9025889.1 bifunctional [glutamate--ammonia ligase]-adenylyl-L-tyrosine phosphorylase/[glutamate--ammonia-ligase] adenylyltransferase [Laribacter hongkongensis]MCG9094127.1 bifunctional [glutamate--ammonia ligase]-adenylyl-L-tyrosine phosphorylase/[glutamate--ammonia-ligase] adenylyltransferase [Laribacter hongkongensis]MCG9098660.1 bifunctiona
MGKSIARRARLNIMQQNPLSIALTHSDWLRRTLAADPALEARLIAELERPFTRADMAVMLAACPLDSEDAVKHALRKLRQAVLARLIARDLSGRATLDEVMATISGLAIFSVDAALRALKPLLARYGEPVGEETGSIQELTVIGMGKLGGDELNVSSDIDLIFVYPEAGETNGERSISNQEYFTLLGKKLIAAINEPTADGFVFRVDMRLRPYGDAGPLVMNLNALEGYLITQGREWERYAWIKARVLTGDAASVYDLARPFVYRKYLDYNAYAAMRDLYQQIQQEVARRDLADNIKLGPGGIREAEFIAQVFQLIRGGREKSLQVRSTREAYRRLAELKLLEQDAVDELLAAYAFLRNLEHRIQYLDDQQTQTLPDKPELQARIAASMGFADWNSFLARLNRVRATVHRHFEQVFFLPTEDHAEHPLLGLWQTIDTPEAAGKLAGLGYHAADETARQLATVRHSQRYQQLPPKNRHRFDSLIPALIEVAASHGNPDETLMRILGLMEAISRRSSYLALLSEYPQTLRRVASLCSSSPWVSNYLTRHPILLDELLDARVLYAEPDWPALRQQLDSQLADADGDVENLMDTLRHFQHAQQFRLVAQDIAGMWPLEALSDQISLLADVVLEAAVRYAWRDIAKRHREVPRFAVIGYGKLGGKELGYGSDLDLIFLYDDPDPDAGELYARLGRKLSTWLTAATPAGVLYDIDLRLRPDGAAGLLVSSVEAFAGYQTNKAWLWEHQALTRARFCAGDSEVGDRFEKTRFDVLTTPRDIATLRDEVLAMRERMLETHPAQETSLKHARGGLVDVEFIVQYLVLAHSHYYPELTGNLGNIALLGLAANADLIGHDMARQAQDAYRHYRRLQHAERLEGQRGVSVDDTLRQHHAHVQALWQAVFG